MRILIAGICGGIARQLALRLATSGHEVIGIDTRPWKGGPAPIELHAVDIRKRAAEEVFRKRRPQVVLHMATVSALQDVSGGERHRINLGGTEAVFEYAARHGVEHTVFVGRHTYYGAGSDLPLYHRESEPPSELDEYPELADLVAADLYAGSALWRLPQMTTTVVRFCYSLGTSGTGTLATFIRGRLVPLVLGFDPLFQFLDESDTVEALVKCVEKRPRGVFNVAGPPPLPLSVIAIEAGRTTIPVPEPLLARVLGRFGLPRLPRGALTHIKYPIVVDGSAFREATGFRHSKDEITTVRDFARKFPVGG